VARAILDSSGVHDVRIEPTHGLLSDHYHPLQNRLRLSQANYAGDSVAAAGVAAHEVGHAIQHVQGYFPLMVRSALVPVCLAGQWIGRIAMPIGVLPTAFGQNMLIWAILGYGAVFAFNLVTLPVEFNASSRALRILASQGILADEELPAAKRVLDAAALTYVASAVQVLLVLIHLILLLNRARN
jgi:Zn-dependent membrane protease YugP